MSETNAAADEPFFQALLTPHRSLGRTGRGLRMAFEPSRSFDAGIPFRLGFFIVPL
jgi:uncharacterized membrane protein